MLTTLRRMTKWLLGIILLAFVVMIFFDWGMQAFRWGAADRWAASVDGEEIPVDAFEARVRAAEASSATVSDTDRRRLQAAVLEQMVREILVRRAAEAWGLGVPADEIAEYVQQTQFRKEDGSIDMDGYRQALRRLPPREWNRIAGEIRRQLGLGKAERYVGAASLIAPPEEVRAYYDWKFATAVVRHILVEPGAFVPRERAFAEYRAYPDSFLIPERTRIRHVVWGLPQGAGEPDRIALRARAEETRLRITSPAAYDRLYAEIRDDTDPLTAAEDLEWLYHGGFAPFETFAFSAPVGAASDVIATPFGYHIVRIDDREETHVRPFDEVEEDLRARLAGETEVARARAAAESALAEVRAGAPFEEVARRFSTAESARTGGLLGAVARGDLTAEVYGDDTRTIERIRDEAGRVELREGRLVALLDPSFADAAFSLEPGGVSEVVASARGFHVIRLEERRAADPLLWEARAPQIEREYLGRKREALFRAWVERLRKEADVRFHPAYRDLEGLVGS